MAKSRKHPTLIEVARKAGVGATTVSRAINGGAHVDPKTLARIQRAIEALGYMPNQAARTLKGDRTRIIGFVIPSIADPFFAACAEAAQAVAKLHDSLLIVLTTQNNGKAEHDAIRMLMRHRADGFILAPSDSHNGQLSELVRRIPVPVVALDRPIQGNSICSVLADSYSGAQLATQHLIDHGYRHIACIASETELYTIQERLRGYRETVERAGLPAMVENTVIDQGSVERCVQRLLAGSPAPQAIFTVKNQVTIDVFQALQKLGTRVPEQVALLGYDDFELADMVRPSISVVQQPIEQIGHIAAELLFQQLGTAAGGDGGRAGVHAASVQLKALLVRRRSCGCRPLESEQHAAHEREGQLSEQD
jgi:LacI family transcriptional regulator